MADISISFYVKECDEFPVMGYEKHDLTLAEAVKIYKANHFENSLYVSSLGVTYHDPSDDLFDDTDIPIILGDKVDRDVLSIMPDVIQNCPAIKDAFEKAEAAYKKAKNESPIQFVEAAAAVHRRRGR